MNRDAHGLHWDLEPGLTFLNHGSFGAIGFYDDFTKVRKMRNLGLTARKKFALQVVAAMAVGFCLLLLHGAGSYSTAINIPFFKQFKPEGQALVNTRLGQLSPQVPQSAQGPPDGPWR